MRNIFVLISLFFTFLNADYLNTKDKNRCVYDVIPYVNHRGLCYKRRGDATVRCNQNLRYKDLINGYNLTGVLCVLSENLVTTGLSYSDYKYLQALNGTLYGFTLTFMLSFLFVLLGKR